MTYSTTSDYRLPAGTPGTSNPSGAGRHAKRALGLAAVASVIGFAATQGISHPASAADTNPHSISQTTSWNSTSDNWSGYAETAAQTGQHYTQAAAEWVVPSVSTLRASGNGVGCAALWTGIGGATSRDLIQLGTDSCSNSSETGYFAWYEVLPAAGTPVQSIRIQPGDEVYASLQLVSGGATGGTEQSRAAYGDVVALLEKFDPSFGTNDMIERLRQLLAEGQARLESEPWWPELTAELHELFGSTTPTDAGNQVWKLDFRVTSPDGAVQNWTKTLEYQSSLSSVEFITEAPTGQSGVQPLPNYGIAHFVGTEADGSTPSFSASNQIELGDPHGQASVPSAPIGQYDAFNTCYFPSYQVSSCPVPSASGN